MTDYRSLTAEEISRLEAQGCSAADWNRIKVAPRFVPDHVLDVRFSGDIRLGVFEGGFTLPGGVERSAGLYHATLHNVTVGDGCCIEWVKNCIANYEIGRSSFISNVDTMLVEGDTSFGNGVEVAVLSETGGREVLIYDTLSSHEAYMMAFYRHRPQLIAQMKKLIAAYVRQCTSSRGSVGEKVMIQGAGRIENVRIGDCCTITGAGRLKNGSVNSTADAPVTVGYGVLCDDFIISSGAKVTDGAMLTRCFVGQATHIGHGYSAADSLFFCNCQEENGEACAIFAGPFTVTHHKSTLLIGGMFSFMNAGSGSNQSNHMYKLGPSHQGILERGSKTASSSYILWPARIGAFSMVIGHHVTHPDTADLPFSYLIEDKGVAYLVPGVNLRSVGTARDADKWPKRDGRTGSLLLDKIHFGLLTPYTVQKMLDGIRLLKKLEAEMKPDAPLCVYQGMMLRRQSLQRGIVLYEAAVSKFFGDQLLQRLEKAGKDTVEDVRKVLKPETETGTGQWVDLSGLLAPKSETDRLIAAIEQGQVDDTDQLQKELDGLYRNYEAYAWKWTAAEIQKAYGWAVETASVENLCKLIRRWLESVIWLDGQIYADGQKEFSEQTMIGFGLDGNDIDRVNDFEAVRGTADTNAFMEAILADKELTEEKGNEWISRLQGLS